MFDPSSRYRDLPTRTHGSGDGAAVVYVTRRFVPQPESLALLAQVEVQPGQRLDSIAARTLGDPRLFWRIADANAALDPVELTARPGEPLRIPLLLPGAGT